MLTSSPESGHYRAGEILAEVAEESQRIMAKNRADHERSGESKENERFEGSEEGRIHG